MRQLIRLDLFCSFLCLCLLLKQAGLQAATVVQDAAFLPGAETNQVAYSDAAQKENAAPPYPSHELAESTASAVTASNKPASPSKTSAADALEAAGFSDASDAYPAPGMDAELDPASDGDPEAAETTVAADLDPELGLPPSLSPNQTTNGDDDGDASFADEEEDIRDVEGLIPYQWQLPWWAYLCIVLGVAAMIWIVPWIRRQALKQKPLTPHAKARESLAQAQTLLDSGASTEAVSRSELALRTYLDDAFSLKTREQTTQEFEGAFIENEIIDESMKTQLFDFFKSCDPVKFAGQALPTRDAKIFIEKANHLIDALHEKRKAREAKKT